jgi:hypothetical protein
MEGNGIDPGFFSIHMFLFDAVNLTPQLSAYPLHNNILRRSVGCSDFFYLANYSLSQCLSAEKYSTFKLENLQFYFICFFTTRSIQKSLRLQNFLLKNSAENVYLFAELAQIVIFLLITVICYLLPLLESNNNVLKNMSNDVKSNNLVLNIYA